MPKGNPLYQIVYTLKFSERKGLKSHILHEKGKRSKQLLQLFEMIETCQTTMEVDEISDVATERYNRTVTSAIKKLIPDPTFLKQLPYWKNHLYKLVLQYLRENDKKKEDYFNKIQERRENGMLLLKRGLEHLAIVELDKGKQLAQKEDIISLLQYELILRAFMHEFEPERQKIEAAKNRSHTALSSMTLEIELFDIFEELYLSQRDNEQIDKEKFDLSLKDVLAKIGIYFDEQDVEGIRLNLNKVIGNLSTNSSFYLYHLLVSYYKHLKNTKASLYFLSDLVAYLDEKPHFKLTYQSQYLNLLNNLLNIQFSENDIDGMEATIKKLENFVDISPTLNYKWRQHFHYYKMIYFLTKEAYEDMLQLEKDISVAWKKYKTILPISRKMAFAYNLASSCLILYKYNRAKFWCDTVMEIKNKKIRLDVRYRTRLLEVLIAFDKNLCNGEETNMKAEYLMKNLYRSAIIRADKIPLLKGVVLNIKKLLDVEPIHRKTTITEILNEWKQDDKIARSYREIIYWLNNRLNSLN